MKPICGAASCHHADRRLTLRRLAAIGASAFGCILMGRLPGLLCRPFGIQMVRDVR